MSESVASGCADAVVDCGVIGCGEACERKPQPLLVVERVSKLFPVVSGFCGKTCFVRAVDGVSFEVGFGETLALVGESGCGKTTLGRCVLRLVEPTGGRIVFDGVELSLLSQRRLRSYRRRMQIVFQDPYGSLNPRMRVIDIVAEGIRIHKLVRDSELRDRAIGILESVGLSSDMSKRMPHEMSAGQRQRLGIARALSVEPSFIVCDEPVSALDVSVRAQIVNLLLDLQEERRIAYLFISHDLDLVRYISHRVAVMYLGRLVEVGGIDDVFGCPMHPYTRDLLSSGPVAGTRRLWRRNAMVSENPGHAIQPLGCAFHPRCSKSDGLLCVSEVPVLRSMVVGADRCVACWYPDVD